MIKFLVYQEGLQGADFRTLEPMAGIRLKKIIPGVPAGAVGCRIQDPGTHGKQQANSGGKQPTFRTARAAHGAPPMTSNVRTARQVKINDDRDMLGTVPCRHMGADQDMGATTMESQ